jgi:short-subunit dehydrogenase
MVKEVGENAQAFPADVADSASIEKAFAEIKTSLGSPTVLVYNAAKLTTGKPSEINVATLIDDFKVNVAGALASALAVIPDMKADGNGTILFTGGGLAMYPSAMYASLSVGKAAMRSLAFTLNEDLKDSGIFVGTVTIGGTVEAGTFFDPDTIAEKYWELHTNRTPAEIVYRKA